MEFKFNSDHWADAKVTWHLVKWTIHYFKLYKSEGPDILTPEMLQRCGNIFIIQLSGIINACLRISCTTIKQTYLQYC